MSSPINGHAQTDFDFGPQHGGVDLTRVLWGHKFLLLVIVAIAVGLGYLYYERATRVYQSSADILLIKKNVELPVSTPDQQFNYEDQLSTHAILIRSPLIVEKAVTDHDLASLPSLSASANPVAVIIGGLKAERGGTREMPDPNVFTLSYKGLNADDCEKILNAVIAAYQDYLGDTYQGFGDDTIQLISQAKDDLHEHLTKTQNDYRNFREESPLLWKGEDGATIHEMRMSAAETARSEAFIDKAQTEALLDTLQSAVASGASQKALEFFIDIQEEKANKLVIANEKSEEVPDLPRSETDRVLLDAIVQEQILLESYGPDHPKVKSAHKKVEMIRQQLESIDQTEAELKAEVAAKTEEKKQPEGPEEEPVDLVAAYIESLQHKLAEADSRLKRFDELFEREREAAKAMADVTAQDETFREELASTKQLFDVIVKRLEEMSLIRDYGGVTAQVISAPSVGRQVQPVLAITLTIAGVLGAVLAFGLAYLLEISDRRFEGPDDVHRELELPVVGHIPVIASKQVASKIRKGHDALSAIHPTVCTVHLPQGRQAESYRAVRTALAARPNARDQKIIQVTSPVPGDGKTTLAANLAVAIAKGGKRVLLMDADGRRPRVHRLFGLKNEIGLSNVLEGDMEVMDVIEDSVVENLSILPCGRRLTNPGDQIGSARFEALFGFLREKFDLVIVDTPPLLAVTDPAEIAKHTDAVLLVIRLTKDSRVTATRASEMLRAVGATPAGVVINGLAQGQGRYGNYRYGGYRYGGYRYGGQRYGGYSYGYSYGKYNEGSEYYSETPKSQEQEEPVN